MMAKEKPPITVVGDVGGRIAIIVVRSQVTDIHRYRVHRTVERDKLLLLSH